MLPHGPQFRGFLGEIASHGAIPIATGPAFVDPETYVDTGNVTTDKNPGALTEAVDWSDGQCWDGQVCAC